MKVWKQNLGDDATYKKLISAFESAGYQEYAKNIKQLLLTNLSTSSDERNSSDDNLVAPLPPSPVFPIIADTVLLHKKGMANINVIYIITWLLTRCLNFSAYYVYVFTI